MENFNFFENKKIDTIKLVNRCLMLESSGDIELLQNSLYELYSSINKPGGGKVILEYPEKANLALCFIFMLHYDWMNDPDIREVWAENGFYCLVDYIQHQSHGMQGQSEGMLLLFSLLSVGRNSLKPKIDNILNKAKLLHNPVFHVDDYNLGAQNVIDQISLMAVSGVLELGPKAIPVIEQVILKFNGNSFFEQTLEKRDLMKYDVMDVFEKTKFIKSVIESILRDM